MQGINPNSRCIPLCLSHGWVRTCRSPTSAGLSSFSPINIAWIFFAGVHPIFKQNQNHIKLVLYPIISQCWSYSQYLSEFDGNQSNFHHFPPLSTIQMAIQPYKSWNIRIIFRVSLEPSVGAPTITCMPRKPSGRGRSRPLAWRIDYFSIFFGVVYRVCTCTVIIYYTFIYIYIIYYTYWYDWVRYIYIYIV